MSGKTSYCIQDTAAAIQNMLAAYSFGLGSCWIEAFKEDPIRIVIWVPKEMRPIALIQIGLSKRSTFSKKLADR